MKRIQLSDHFDIKKILLFSLPSIGMQIVDNSYQIADGYFISNYIGEAAFDGENLIFPALLIVMYVGLMFGTGASALISKELGEDRREKANRILSMAILILTVTGVALSALLWIAAGGLTQWAVALAAAGLCFAYYHGMSERQFGGVTGDLAGWFVQVTELALVAVVALGGRLS